MRRPRPCLVNTGWGGAGAPPGLRPCQELADGRGPKGLDEKRGPAPEEERRDGAPKGATHRKMRALKYWLRLTACHPPRTLPGGEEK